MSSVRKPAVAGIFYPADKEELSLLVNSMVSEGETGDEKVFGLISPHAGYMYSGLTAAKAYARLKGKTYGKVIILSPSHFEYFPGISVYDGDAYQTPLGTIPVDEELRQKLLDSSKLIFASSKGHGREHAIETQLPFLQTVLENDFTILPIVIGDQKREFVFNLADALPGIIDDNTLIVVSSDLSHYHNKREAKKIDDKTAKTVEMFDYEALQSLLDKGTCEACGGGGITALLRAASNMGKNKISIIDRSDSGDFTEDDSKVVGYLSAVIYS